MAITVDHLTGFEVGVHSVNGGAVGVPGSVTAQTNASILSGGTQRSGSYAARVAPTAVAAGSVRFNCLQTAASRRIWRFAMRVPVMPVATNVRVFEVHFSATLKGYVRVDSTGLIQLSADGISWFGSTVLTNPTTTWHIIELKLDYSTGTSFWTWRVNGFDQTGTSQVVASQAPSIWTLGTTGTTGAAATIDFDDVITGIWTVAGDWFGDGEILALIPGSDGAHSFTDNDFSTGDAGTQRAQAYTDFYLMVDERPMSATRSTTDNIGQRVIRTGGYVELKPAPAPGKPPANAVRCALAYSSSTTTANNGGCVVRNSAGAEVVVWGTQAAKADYSETGNQFKQGIATKPAAGWTPAEIDAVRIRCGFADDISPVPTWQTLLLEVDYPRVPLPRKRNPLRSRAIPVGGAAYR